MFGFFKKKKHNRGHLRVLLTEGEVRCAFQVVEPLEPGELMAALHASLIQVRELNQEARERRVEGWIQDIQRELGVLDKLRKKGRWETEARNVVPGERFVGESRGVSLTIDGELAYVSVELAGPSATDEPQRVLREVASAQASAEAQARERWASCIRGALEEVGDEA